MKRNTTRTWSKRQIVLSAILAVVVAVPVAIAILHDGFPSSEIHMESRDVWVTNADDVMAGRLNAQIQELDGSVSLTSENVMIQQDGDDVFLHDVTSGLLGRVDPGYTDLRESIVTPAGSVSAYGDGLLAILDPETGSVWAIDTDSALTFDASSAEPVMELGAGAQIVVTQEGTIIGASPSESALFRVTEPGEEPVRSRLAAFEDYELTAVGERAAVLDRTSNSVLFEGGTTVALPETGVRIQQRGDDDDAVVVAGATGLMLVPFSGEPLLLEPQIVAGGRDPKTVAQPVSLGGCYFGAYAAPKELTRLCEGQAPEVHEIPQSIEGEIMFRVNRNVIVLNDLRSGNIWLPQENMRFVENWQDTVPPEDEEGTDGENEATEESFEDTLAERTEENHPPELNDDVFGVRPGSVAYMPVLDNDTDPDGDLITITEIKGEVPASLGTLHVIDEGRALQFEATEGAAGEFTVGYVGSDGREGGIAEANLTIEVVPGTVENRPPESRYKATVTVEAGQKVSYNVLSDWIDPDGDPMYLLSASPTGGTEVSANPDGTITVTAVGAELGKRIVPYVISDGVSTSTGELTVDVAAPQSLAPVGTPDYARGQAGTTITASPLANDLSPSGGPLSIVEIAELGDGAGGATFNPDLGTVSYRASTPGTYYVQYTLSSGTHDSIGLIRFDVLDPNDVDSSMTAVRDVGYLRPGVPTTIDVLTNDMSMSDRVLSVQAVTLTDEARIAGVAIELLDNTLVRATSQSALLEPIEISYTITDGEQSAEGIIVLVPVEPVVTRQPPIAVDDTRKVRVGDFTSVDVLANDLHPDDVAMTVSPELTDLDIGGGVAFVTNNQVRFQAPSTPGTYSVGYIVTDDYGEQGGATVTFQVIADDEAANRPPAPVTETARVFEGASILVQIPLTGVDPDGDSVTFTGAIGTPSLGSIREENQTSFVYEAFPGASGTDTIRYEVVDTYGQRAEGVIKIGVVPRGDQVQPPVAVDDAYYARPGAIISVPVLQNDSDPNGYTISLVDDFSEVDPALEPEIDGDAILLQMPDEGEYVTVPYTITNDHGGFSTAWINITLAGDVPDQPPTSVDQVVPLSAFDGQDSFDVDPTVGAFNPTGRLADLEVGVAGTNASAAEVRPDGTIRVTPTDRRQVIAYTLTSADTGLTATAFIMVPGIVTEQSKRQSPYLDPELPEQITPVDTPLQWNVNDLVVAPSGNRITVIDAANAWAEQGDGSPVAVSDDTVRFVPKPGFRGPASITFMVSDATGPDDENAGVATIRLKITVGDPNFYDVPPTFVTPQVTVEVDTTTTLDLTTVTAHPNPDVIPQIEYSQLTGGATGVEASLSGSTLSVSAAIDTKVGTIVPLQVTYAFKEFTLTGTINVTVVSSTKPMPRPADDESLARRGETVMINATANDFNPYPDVPLRLIEAVEESATSTGAKVSIVDNQIRIEPSASFIGTITVRYKIGDGTLDPMREQYGYATLRVRDVPSPPASAAIESLGDMKLRGSWEQAASNGEPITEYELVLEPSSEQYAPIVIRVGASSSYTFDRSDGLVGGVNYRLTVRAYNMLGWGNASTPSETVTPIDKPDAPQSINVSSEFTEPGKTTGTLYVTWEPPTRTGGEIQKYQIEIVSPNHVKRTITVNADTRQVALDGLKVDKGGAIQVGVTVTAINREGSSTSNVHYGTLTYLPEPEVTALEGAVAHTDPATGQEFSNIWAKGYGLEADVTYTIVCWQGKSKNSWVDTRLGEVKISGAELAKGLTITSLPDCAPHRGAPFYIQLRKVIVTIAESDIVNG